LLILINIKFHKIFIFF